MNDRGELGGFTRDEIDEQVEPVERIKPKKKWRWWQIALTVAGAVLLGLNLLGGGGSLDLEVRRTGRWTGGDQVVLDVTNTGNKTINIVGATFNDRPDCKLFGVYPKELKIGDTEQLFSSCQIIRATIKTDQGSATYSFTAR